MVVTKFKFQIVVYLLGRHINFTTVWDQKYNPRTHQGKWTSLLRRKLQANSKSLLFKQLESQKSANKAGRKAGVHFIVRGCVTFFYLLLPSQQLTWVAWIGRWQKSPFALCILQGVATVTLTGNHSLLFLKVEGEEMVGILAISLSEQVVLNIF